MPKNYVNPKTGQPCDYDEYTRACANVPAYETPGWHDPDTGEVISQPGISPSTGQPWTGEELVSAASTGAASTSYGFEVWPEGFPTTTEEYNAIRQTPEYQNLISSYGVNPITGQAATGGNINPYTGVAFTTADLSGMGVATVSDFWNFYNQGLIQLVENQYQYVGEPGVVGTGGWGDNPPVPYNIPGVGFLPGGVAPTGGGQALPSGFQPGAITPVGVTPAPAYTISPEQQKLQETLGTKLTDWVEAGGYGLPPEIQAQMIQQQTDTLKAREQENIRVMRNNMERKGITNSGYVQANENMITSNTTVAIAGAIADVQIKSALMKMASFEKAMGAAAQFLGYLSEQSQLAYAPKFATWSAEQLAKMQAWQASFDVYKMAINQAYQQQNIQLTAQLQSQLAEQTHGYDIELAEMEIEAQQQAAAAEGAGQLMGSASGLVGSLIAGS